MSIHPQNGRQITVVDVPSQQRTYAYSSYGHRTGRSYVTSRRDAFRIKTLENAARADALDLAVLQQTATGIRSLIEMSQEMLRPGSPEHLTLGRYLRMPIPVDDQRQLVVYVDQMRVIYLAFQEYRKHEEEWEAKVSVLRAEDEACRQEEARQQAICDREHRERCEALRKERIAAEADEMRATIARNEYVSVFRLRELHRQGAFSQIELDAGLAVIEAEKIRHAEEDRVRREAWQARARREAQEDAFEASMERWFVRLAIRDMYDAHEAHVHRSNRDKKTHRYGFDPDERKRWRREAQRS
ncbi:MAG: hypothetical protein AAB839_00205 [Patescibacteria group bacterium]